MCLQFKEYLYLVVEKYYFRRDPQFGQNLVFSLTIWFPHLEHFLWNLLNSFALRVWYSSRAGLDSFELRKKTNIMIPIIIKPNINKLIPLLLLISQSINDIIAPPT